MFDAIRKAAKKRDQNQKANGESACWILICHGLISLSTAAQKKPAAVHDTHGQYAKMAKYSPAELSRIKADKEQKDQEWGRLCKTTARGATTADATTTAAD